MPTISHNDSVQNAYLNKLTKEYPYTGYKAKKESIHVANGETASHIRSKYSSEPICGDKGLRHDEDCSVVPGSLPKRRARDFFNELEKNGYLKRETMQLPGNPVLDFFFGKDEVPVVSIKMPKNENNKYPNLKYFMELTNLPAEAFVNLPKEALENPGKYVLKGTVHIKEEYVNKLYN